MSETASERRDAIAAGLWYTVGSGSSWWVENIQRRICIAAFSEREALDIRNALNRNVFCE